MQSAGDPGNGPPGKRTAGRTDRRATAFPHSRVAARDTEGYIEAVTRAQSSSQAPGAACASPFSVWLVAFLAALALYVATACRGVQWQDSGSQQLRIVTGQLDHPLGLALTHPLQYYLGRAAIRLRFLEPAFAITLVSSLAAAVAVANLAAALKTLTRQALPAAIAAAAFALSHTFWQHATHTESYALVAAFLAAEWLCLARFAVGGGGRWLILLALFNGLGIANHPLALLATPVDAVVIAWAVRGGRLPRRAAAAVGLWIAGTLPYSALVVATALRTGDWAGAIHSALFGRYAADVLNTRIGARTILTALGFVAYNLPGLTIPLAVYALVACRDVPKVFSRAIAAQLVLYGLFVVRYTITDQYSYFFPVYALLAVLAGAGLAHRTARGPAAWRRPVLALAGITALWTPLVYVAAARVAASRGVLASRIPNKPYRDGYRAFLLPWGVGDRYGEAVNEHATRLAGGDGLILVADPMIEFGVRYAEALGRIPRDVRIRPIELAANEPVVAERRELLSAYIRRGRPVVLVPRDRDHPRTCVPEAKWRRDGDLYVLERLGTE